MAYAFDWAADYAQSLVATAPSPATSGTSLTVTTGQGSNFPDPAVVGPYNCVDCPGASAATLANAEEVRVTAKAGDVFTFTRAQGPSSARTILVGDRFFLGSLAKSLTDLQAVIVGMTPGARLTLTTGVPVTTSDVLAATTLYYSPCGIGQIALYNGTRWIVDSFSADLSIAVPATTSQLYDVFIYDVNGTATLELLAWTNDTTRATALARQNGILVKSGTPTRRYVGSFRTTTVSGQTEDSVKKRYVWNYYNRARRPMRVVETGTWAYTTATYRQANGNAANQLDLVCGVAEDALDVRLKVGLANSAASVRVNASIGEDSTSTPSTSVMECVIDTVANTAHDLSASLTLVPAAGRHTYPWLEKSAATGTSTWRGDLSGNGAGLSAVWLA